jgi:hypothetical protein
VSDSVDEKILIELRRMTRLLALFLVKDRATLTDQVEALNLYGFRPVEIADMLGEKPNKISAILSYIKKKTQEKTAKRTTENLSDKGND